MVILIDGAPDIKGMNKRLSSSGSSTSIRMRHAFWRCREIKVGRQEEKQSPSTRLRIKAIMYCLLFSCMRREGRCSRMDETSTCGGADIADRVGGRADAVCRCMYCVLVYICMYIMRIRGSNHPMSPPPGICAYCTVVAAAGAPIEQTKKQLPCPKWEAMLGANSIRAISRAHIRTRLIRSTLLLLPRTKSNCSLSNCHSVTWTWQ
jgi:hypothetical protein